MSESPRGGRRYRVEVFNKKLGGSNESRIIVSRIRYTHSNGARMRCGGGVSLPLIDTGFHRPRKALRLFIEEALDRNVFGFSDFECVLVERSNRNIVDAFSKLFTGW